jgi:hypothetical protein
VNEPPHETLGVQCRRGSVGRRPRGRQPEGQRLAASCEVDGLGRAEPPRRIVELIRRVAAAGGNGAVASICEEDLGRIARTVTSSIQACWSSGRCLARSPPVDDAGHVPCVIVESVPGSDSCPEERIDLGVRNGRRRCRLCRVGDAEAEPVGEDWVADLDLCTAIEGAGAAWRFVASASCAGSGEVLLGACGKPRPGSPVDLECLTRVCAE